MKMKLLGPFEGDMGNRVGTMIRSFEVAREGRGNPAALVQSLDLMREAYRGASDADLKTLWEVGEQLQPAFMGDAPVITRHGEEGARAAKLIEAFNVARSGTGLGAVADMINLIRDAFDGATPEEKAMLSALMDALDDDDPAPAADPEPAASESVEAMWRRIFPGEITPRPFEGLKPVVVPAEPPTLYPEAQADQWNIRGRSYRYIADLDAYLPLEIA